MIPLLLALGCAQPPAPEAEIESVLVPLDTLPLARRLSLDLRGKNPSIEELDALEADPGALDGLVDSWMEGPAFEERLVDLFAEQWLTRVDEFPVPPADFGLSSEQNFPFLRSVGEEPLRLMAHVGARDLPWSEILTADYTMTNDLLMSIWDLEYLDPTETSDWKTARYGDGRPAGGVLMTNGLWWRYSTTLTNYNRGRAAALANLLLCFNVPERPVAFTGFTAVTQEALLEATRSNPDCQACHSGIDPLAANLFGFWWFETKDASEMSVYHPDREPLGRLFLQLEPSFFGEPVDGTANLGKTIAADPRFAQCTVQHMAGSLWRRGTDIDDFNGLQDLVATFSAGDLRLKTLIKAILATEEYRAGSVTEAASDEEDDRYVTSHLLSPKQLASAVEDLTGFRWEDNAYDQLDNDLFGYRVMAGGLDGEVVTTMAGDPSLTRSLVIKRLAQAAASVGVASDLAADPADRRLFSAEDPLALDPDGAAFRNELEHLHRRIHGTVPDDDTLDSEVALWKVVAANADPTTAWTSLVTVLLRDPAFWSD